MIDFTGLSLNKFRFRPVFVLSCFAERILFGACRLNKVVRRFYVSSDLMSIPEQNWPSSRCKIGQFGRGLAAPWRACSPDS